MESVRVGIVGSGFMGLTYAAALSTQVRGATLAGIAAGRRAPALAAEYEVPAFSDLSEMLDQCELDAVVLATPDTVHCEQALLAASAGKHVLVEKPMAPTVEQCDRMISACEGAGVNLAVVQTERFRTLTMKAKELIDSGRIGDVRMLRTVSMFPFEVAKQIVADRPWYVDPAGGGLFMGIASHNTDFLLWLTGSRATRVYAKVDTFEPTGWDAQSVMAHIEFESGAMAQMWITAEAPAASMPSSEVRFQAMGSRGTIDLENFEFLDLGEGESWERIFIPPKFDYFKEPKHPARLEPHARVIQEFVDSVLESRPPRVGGREGRAAVEVCEACLVSSRTGAVVNLPLTSTNTP